MVFKKWFSKMVPSNGVVVIELADSRTLSKKVV